MDKLSQYRDVVVHVLGETAASMNRPANDSIQAQTIFDSTTDHYMVLDVGGQISSGFGLLLSMSDWLAVKFGWKKIGQRKGLQPIF